jgi:hypothetical protein
MPLPFFSNFEGLLRKIYCCYLYLSEMLDNDKQTGKRL